MIRFLQIPIDSLLRDTTTLSVENISGKLSSFQNMTGPEILSTLVEDFIKFGLKFLAAILIYLIGACIIKRIKRWMKRVFDKKGTEASLSGFLTSLVNIILIVTLVVIVVGTLGISTTSLAAILASGGLAIGMALSGTLQNLAGGVMILASKPFKVGDYIEAQGYTGTVDSISITSTKLTTVDNKLVIIPNGGLANGSLKNYSSTGLRRVDWTVSISYGDDFDKAKEVIISMLSKDARVLNSPDAPAVLLGELAESSINVFVRVWVDVNDYWNVFYYYNEMFYKELPKHGLNFPYPHITIVKE